MATVEAGGQDVLVDDLAPLGVGHLPLNLENHVGDDWLACVVKKSGAVGVERSDLVCAMQMHQSLRYGGDGKGVRPGLFAHGLDPWRRCFQKWPQRDFKQTGAYALGTKAGNGLLGGSSWVMARAGCVGDLGELTCQFGVGCEQGGHAAEREVGRAEQV